MKLRSHKGLCIGIAAVFVAAAVVTAVIVVAARSRSYPHKPGANLAQSPFSAAAESKKAAQDLVLPFNAVQRYFYSGQGDEALNIRFGNEPTYFEWMALKTAWTGDAEYTRALKDKIVSFPQTDNGYLWSWGDSTYWPTGKGELHYDGLFRYVSAVSELIRWDGNADFLNEVDATTQGADRALDASEGRTVYEKCRAAMAYAYDLLDGKNGLITLTEKSAFLADGKTRFDVNADGETVWNNTGKAGSASSNYWDNLCFGNRDAYETMLYYHALVSMSEIERARGDQNEAARYTRLAETVKEAFNRTFWSEETGRYIACVDTDGVRWDPGLTFLNTEALCYGLADQEQAGSIFAWIDGERIVQSDTITGKDITDYSLLLNDALGHKVTKKDLRFVPVSNTVSIEQLSGDGEPWWFDLEGAILVGEGNNAAYRHHLENGGYIFYTLYYELTARAAYLGPESVQKRAAELAAVYRFNGFDSNIGTWVEGMTGTFPESGMVSRAFVSALCGVNTENGRLVIAPRLPDGIDDLGIEKLSYQNVPFTLNVGRDTLTVKAETALKGTIVFRPEKPGKYTAELTLANGKTETVAGENEIVINTDGKDVKEIRIGGRQ